MIHTKNNIPLYEEQQFIQEEQQIEQIQEILSKFSQPIPSKFTKLEQLNWMCSTQGWKEPLCERYNCLINGKWSQVDIRHTLLEKLGITEVKNVSYPVYISPTVLDKGLDHYFAYNIEDEAEIFFKKPFIIQNLKKDIDKLFKEIEELEKDKEENQKTIARLEKENREIKTNRKYWENEYRKEKKKTKELEKQLKKWTEQFRNQTPDKVQDKITSLTNERNDRPNITLDQWNNDYKQRPTQQEYLKLLRWLGMYRNSGVLPISVSNIGHFRVDKEFVEQHVPTGQAIYGDQILFVKIRDNVISLNENSGSLIDLYNDLPKFNHVVLLNNIVRSGDLISTKTYKMAVRLTGKSFFINKIDKGGNNEYDKETSLINVINGSCAYDTIKKISAEKVGNYCNNEARFEMKFDK